MNYILPKSHQDTKIEFKFESVLIWVTKEEEEEDSKQPKTAEIDDQANSLWK